MCTTSFVVASRPRPLSGGRVNGAVMRALTYAFGALNIATPRNAPSS